MFVFFSLVALDCLLFSSFFVVRALNCPILSAAAVELFYTQHSRQGKAGRRTKRKERGGNKWLPRMSTPLEINTNWREKENQEKRKTAMGVDSLDDCISNKKKEEEKPRKRQQHMGISFSLYLLDDNIEASRLVDSSSRRTLLPADSLYFNGLGSLSVWRKASKWSP